jgi:hypothetical protein
VVWSVIETLQTPKALDRWGEFATLQVLLIFWNAGRFMRLWFVCCVLLFVTAQGYDWISHQAWLVMPDLSLPWLLLGGIGLAIASNRTAFPSASSPQSQRDIPSTVVPPTAPPFSQVPSSGSGTTEPPAVPNPPLKPAASPSISFEIPRQKTRLDA